MDGARKSVSYAASRSDTQPRPSLSCWMCDWSGMVISDTVDPFEKPRLHVMVEKCCTRSTRAQDLCLIITPITVPGCFCDPIGLHSLSLLNWKSPSLSLCLSRIHTHKHTKSSHAFPCSAPGLVSAYFLSWLQAVSFFRSYIYPPGDAHFLWETVYK